MDDRVVEKMVVRSCRALKNPKALCISWGALFCSSIVWMIFRGLLSAVSPSLYLPMFFLSMTMIFVPISSVFVILASRYLAVRLYGQEVSLFHTMCEQRHCASALVTYAIAVCIMQILLITLAALWCGIESIPAMGIVVYFFFSWIPSLLTALMGLIASFHALTILSIGVYGIRTGGTDSGLLRQAVLAIATVQPWTRLRGVIIGFVPLLLFCLFAVPWTVKSIPLPIELLAACIRAGVLSAVASPLLLFAIHMVVETDRYVSRGSQ